MAKALGTLPLTGGLLAPAIENRRAQVFAPLARLLGLYSVKEELEELGFSYSKPDEYVMLRRRLDQLTSEQEPVILKVNWGYLPMLSKPNL